MQRHSLYICIFVCAPWYNNITKALSNKLNGGNPFSAARRLKWQSTYRIIVDGDSDC